MTAPLDVLAQLRIAPGLWVDVAYDFQVDDMRRVLDPDGPPYGFLTRSRGSSKTEDLAAAALSLLLAVDEAALLVWAASDADQGRLAIESIEGFAERSPSIAAQIEVQSRKVIAKASGARIEVLPADAASSWGLRPYAVFVDELANWTEGAGPKRFFDSLASAVAKRSDARLVILTTPSTPDHWAYGVLEHARASASWWTSERRGPAPWMSAERVAEQKARLPRAIFDQLFEAVWSSAADAFLDVDAVAAIFTLLGPATERDPIARYVAGLDLGLTNDRSVLTVLHRVEDGRVHLDRIQAWQGTRKRPVDLAVVEQAVLDARATFGHIRLVGDPWQAASMFQRLRSQGIAVEEFNFSAGSKQRLSSVLLEAVTADGIALFDAEGLRDELLGLRLRQTASGWSFDHRSGGHDDAVMSLALALYGTTETKREPLIIVGQPSGRRDPLLASMEASGSGIAIGDPGFLRRLG